jgi:hypothetical protein
LLWRWRERTPQLLLIVRATHRSIQSAEVELSMMQFYDGYHSLHHPMT